MIDIEKTSEFLNDIKSIDNIEKIKKQKSKLLKLLNLLLKEINNDIDINSLKNLKESQIWAFIFNNSSKTINDYKSQLKNYQDILNELNEYNEENDINKNILGKKIKRNKEDNENKNEEDIEDNENEDIEEFEEMEENEDIKEEDDNFGNKKDIFFSMKDLNNFADQFEEEDNNMNENNDNNNKIKSAPNRLKLSSSRKNNNKKNISEENEEDEEEEDNENNSLYSEEQEIKADINSDEEIKFDKFFDKPEKKLRNIDTSENSDFDENEIFTQIKEIEEKMISKKEWSTRGEVLGKERPKDSLLTKAMDFEVGLKAPPIPDREYTDKLENMIKQRILDDLFDDPIKKNIINLNEEKKADNDELNFEKSKKGLGEIYEEKYLGNEKTENKVDEIKKECDDLCNKLFDIFKSMTNGSATPYGLKGKKEQDINITNIPAIQIEDIGNFISDNKEKIKSGKELYNPNKIRRKNKEEMTSDELRNIHNKKKRNIKSRIHKKENKKKMEELTQMLGSKFEAKIRMKQEKNKRIEKIDKTQGKEYKSGKFFGKINEMAEKEEEKKKKNNKITE
jgi:U3 small nucleolar RNA-associated protein MPP10